TAELVEQWIAFTNQFAPNPFATGGHDRAGPFPVAWPPAPPERASGRPTDGAAAAAGASGERDAVLGELARRLDRIEERLAALERQRRAASPRRRSRERGA